MSEAFKCAFIKKSNHISPFKVCVFQLLKILNFHGGAPKIESLLKAYETSETKGLFSYEKLRDPDKLQNRRLALLLPFKMNLVAVILWKQNAMTMLTCWEMKWLPSKLFWNPNFESQHLLGLVTIKTCIKYCSQKIWDGSDVFWRWCNRRDFVPTWEPMQTMVAFYHDKGVDLWKLGCRLPKVANIFLDNFTQAKFFPSAEQDLAIMERNREYVAGGPSK